VPSRPGERYLNRVWSASTDGYVDEVLDTIELAHEQFSEARRLFDRYAEPASPRGLNAAVRRSLAGRCETVFVKGSW
jgi:hypothetical protein